MHPKFRIPQPNQSKGAIPNPHITAEDHGDKYVVFKFKHYNSSCCEIAGFNRNDAKQFTKTLGEVNQFLAADLLPKGKARHVKDAGHYEVLHNKLPPDVRLVEIDYTDVGRIFGFLVNNEFNVVAVRRKHTRY